VEIAKHVMMWHGASGYTKDLPIEMAFRSVMSYAVGAEGAANIMKLIVVRDTFGNELVATRP
jgi:acyl-CoA dehydrogenase